MSTEQLFVDIQPKTLSLIPTASQVSRGIPIPPVRLLQVFSPDEWEVFAEEWLSFHKNNGTYCAIRRHSGPSDLGLDVVALTSESGFEKPWDSYQCKHYDHALRPNDVYGEVGKIIYHSFLRTPPFNQACRVPRCHVFVAPFGMGITVGRFFKDPNRFKEDVRANWETKCVPKIGKNIKASLEGALLEYFDGFDFSIFGDRTAVELIEEHSQTIFHAARFGGGLPPRGQPVVPPSEPAEAESLYLRKLLSAYSDRLGQAVKDRSDLDAELERHYDRQRILFYSAESLRNFARDSTQPHAFDSLQDDIYYGVVEICETGHPNAFVCLSKTLATAAQVDVNGNALVGVTKVADKQGICHQLANDDRLTWAKRS